jgi:hypothetical protein
MDESMTGVSIRRGPKGLKIAILRSVAGGAETSREVGDDLGISTRRASTYMCRLVARGVLGRLPRKFYADRDCGAGGRFRFGDSPPMVRFVLASDPRNIRPR